MSVWKSDKKLWQTNKWIEWISTTILLILSLLNFTRHTLISLPSLMLLNLKCAVGPSGKWLITTPSKDNWLRAMFLCVMAGFWPYFSFNRVTIKEIFSPWGHGGMATTPKRWNQEFQKCNYQHSWHQTIIDVKQFIIKIVFLVLLLF